MRTRSIIAALACTLGASAAWAQTTGDVGFFRPAADPALTTTRPQPPAPPLAPAPPAAPQAPVNDTAQMAAAELANTRQEDAMRWAEQQMERAEQEALQAREQQQQEAPAGVGAAFTGSTSERDR
jgi:hypothetical protein